MPGEQLHTVKCRLSLINEKKGIAFQSLGMLFCDFVTNDLYLIVPFKDYLSCIRLFNFFFLVAYKLEPLLATSLISPKDHLSFQAETSYSVLFFIKLKWF